MRKVQGESITCTNVFCCYFPGVSATLAALTPRLKDFHQLLVDPPPVSHNLFSLFLLLNTRLDEQPFCEPASATSHS